jgi:hypothetical protein
MTWADRLATDATNCRLMSSFMSFFGSWNALPRVRFEPDRQEPVPTEHRSSRFQDKQSQNWVDFARSFMSRRTAQ